MRDTIMTLFLAIVFLSCEKIGESKSPIIPANDSIDIDNDLVYDFLIQYSSIATMDIPPSHQSITGAIKPLNDNKVLDRESVGNLFLIAGDTIRRVDNSNADWSEYAASVIGINGSKDKWDDNWRIVSDLTDDFYLGVQLKKGDDLKIGWILLEFNKEDGSIGILDKKFTSEPELIIKLE